MDSNRLEPSSETSRWTYSGCLWTAPYRDGGRQDDAVVDAVVVDDVVAVAGKGLETGKQVVDQLVERDLDSAVGGLEG